MRSAPMEFSHNGHSSILSVDIKNIKVIKNVGVGVVVVVESIERFELLTHYATKNFSVNIYKI